MTNNNDSNPNLNKKPKMNENDSHEEISSELDVDKLKEHTTKEPSRRNYTLDPRDKPF